MAVELLAGAGLVLTAVISALIGLFGLAVVTRGAVPDRSAAATGGSVFSIAGPGTTFVFDGDTLVDATAPARALLAQSPLDGGPWMRLLARLGPGFPDLETRVLALPTEGQFLLSATGPGPSLVLRGELTGGLTRLTLIEPEGEGDRPAADPATVISLTEELGHLRRLVQQAPIVVWRERRDGEVIWANAAYLTLVAERLAPGQDLVWPLPRLFDRTASTQGATGQRQRVDLPDGIRWFDMTGMPDGEGRLVFAIPADATVAAETSLREFMQTLTKTFAQLPIGLAIFDRHRLLQLFNPALLDLTGLAPDFLSSRPTLMAVLDAMRDKAMIPEPKDYRSWRRQMTALEEAAASGLFEDTWSLPGGQTYRVIGRPHPNGALALMFEDISTEMSRTRRYRADLELGQAAFDALPDGIAVFSQSGALVMTNAAYGHLWRHDPTEMLSDAGIRTVCRWWRDHSAPTLLWDDAESYVSTIGDRDPWQGDVRLADGRMVGCHFAPLTGGASLVIFRLMPADESRLQPADSLGRMTA